MTWQISTLNTVTLTVGGAEQFFNILVPTEGRYVLENVGGLARVGLWNGSSAVPGQNGLLGICGENVKGTHNNTPAGLLTISVFSLSNGSTQVRLRPFTLLDYWWSIPGLTLYKSTCSISGG